MTTKIPVQIRPYERTRYAYQRLKICRRCGEFTVLGDEECAACGKPSLVPVEEHAEALRHRKVWKERILALVLWAAAIALGSSDLEWAAAGAGGLVLFILLVVLQNKQSEAQYRIQLQQLFAGHEEALIEGLAMDHEAAVVVFKEGDKPLAYEMLREVGLLVHTEQLRIDQIVLLQSFILRKDMDLMLEPLLLRRFSPDLAQYIGEIAKIKRELLKERTFRYVLVHELQILRMPQGEKIMALVTGAAVRMKRYVTMYPHLVIRYARLLPKERFLRLCLIVHSDPHRNWGEVGAEVYRIYQEQYRHDPDFDRMSSMSHLAAASRY